MDDAVNALHERGHAAWPTIALDRAAFAAHIASLGDAGDSLHAEDLYVACACARGDAIAIAIFEKEFLCHVPAYIARTTTSPQVIDEVLQRLRERLLVAKDGAPKIATYTGRGPLGAFIRVASVRIAYDTLPGERSARTSRESDSPSADPELDYIKAAYRDQFVQAIEQAISSLAPRERNALALSLIDGLSTDAIGRMYGKDGATVRRWLGSAREFVLQETKKLLNVKLGATHAELQSLLGILHSRLDVSIVRILKENRDVT